MSQKIYKKDARTLKYLADNWKLFPSYSFYATSRKHNIILNPNKSVYIYSLHKVNDIKPMLVNTNLLYFRLYVFKKLGFSNPVGYAFIPTLPDNHIIRYTPVCITATSPKATQDAVINAERRIIYNTDWFDIMWLSCGCEVITDLANKLGVYLIKE